MSLGQVPPVSSSRHVYGGRQRTWLPPPPKVRQLGEAVKRKSRRNQLEKISSKPIIVSPGVYMRALASCPSHPASHLTHTRAGKNSCFANKETGARELRDFSHTQIQLGFSVLEELTPACGNLGCFLLWGEKETTEGCKSAKQTFSFSPLL